MSDVVLVRESGHLRYFDDLQIGPVVQCWPAGTVAAFPGSMKDAIVGLLGGDGKGTAGTVGNGTSSMSTSPPVAFTLL